METLKKKLPIGIENFEDIIKEDFYYVDKTRFISELLHNWGAVNLFTRPRRFGKSLNMSMLENFFSPEGDKRIFDHLDILKETALCEEYMGKYPVISLSLKEISSLSYEMAFQMAIQTMTETAEKFFFLLESEHLNERDKAEYRKLLDDNMSEARFCGSLKKLSGMLEKHYGSKVILLIDEYDVPLAKAFEYGYYEQMISLIRNLLGKALKTSQRPRSKLTGHQNSSAASCGVFDPRGSRQISMQAWLLGSLLRGNSSLRFAVLTGCLRISKESIFTGLNNLKVLTIADERFDEYFGFTDREVKALLEYYDAADHYDAVKEWYDGYQFGNVDVYCPWDVLNHCDRIRNEPSIQPENYWINTSSNNAVKRFIQESADAATKREIEHLVAGEVITKEIYQELTYPEMYETIGHIWSLLFMTGYLTKRGKAEGRQFRLAIPNLEIRDIFVTQIMELFKENVKEDGETLKRFCAALQNKDADGVEKLFTEYLKKTISIRDTSIRKVMKENFPTGKATTKGTKGQSPSVCFYHGILIGILGVKSRWGVSSNREMGEGYADILVEPDTGDMGIIIEVKYAHDGNLDGACKEALKQIEYTRYEEELLDNGAEHIVKYGIACYKKRCRVMLAEG
ncbi:AAA family ATPase [Lachnospiraceae bacterium 29-91]